MEQQLLSIFADGSLVIMVGTIAAALFFGMAGIRETREIKLEGLLYLALSLFFFCMHFYYLLNLPANALPGSVQNQQMIWGWMVSILAPALIFLFLLIGLFNVIVTHLQIGLLKLLCGATLGGLLYFLGPGWAMDIKAILTAFWSFIWLEVELDLEARVI